MRVHTGAVTVAVRNVNGTRRRRVGQVGRWSMAALFVAAGFAIMILGREAVCIGLPALLAGIALARRTFSEDRLLEVALAFGVGVAVVLVAAPSGQRLILDIVCWDTERRSTIQRTVGEFAWRHLYRELVYSMNRLRPVPGDPLGCPQFPENWD